MSAGGHARPILLLGRDGQLGFELHRALRPFGSVVALGRPDLDLADADAIRTRIRAEQPSLVVNAAAYTAVDMAESEPECAMAVNGTAPGVLAEEAKHLAIPLIHYSTDYVFGDSGPAPRPYRETDETGPLNAYGRSKRAGEAAIQAVGPVHLILRTSWIYSAHGRNFFTTMLRLASERDELTVVADQTGAPTLARDIADATAQILTPAGRSNETGSLAGQTGLYHLSASGETTWHGFASAIVDGARSKGRPVKARKVVPIESADYPSPAKRPSYSVLDNGLIEKTFGIVMPTWRDGLDRCLEDC